MPPQHYDANLDGGLDGGFESGEYDFLEGGGEAPLAEGAIDFDLRTSDPPAGEAAAVSKPRVAVTSGSWPKADATASGSHPVARTAAKPAGPLGLVPKEEVRTLGQRLRVPGILVALGLGLTILDMVVARQMGGNIALGPIKLRWVAAAMAAIGMVYAFYNLVGDKDDDE